MYLFKITLKGCHSPVGVNYNTSYVVAENMDEAYSYRLERINKERSIKMEISNRGILKKEGGSA